MTDSATRGLPVIAGAAQVIQRPGDIELPDARGPIELMADAARAAAEDAGAAKLLSRVDWIGVAGGWFRFADPGRLVADEIGASDAKTAFTAVTGNAPQDLLGLASQRISRGELDVALVLGGEARWSHRRLKRTGQEPSWSTSRGEGDAEMLFASPEGDSEAIETFGGAPGGYALLEDSLRAAHGVTVDDHRDFIAALWERFSTAASANPYAWDRAARSGAEIREATADNRMIAFPYTLAMVANNTVDMGSAILLCSVEAAESAGVSPDRFVFPHVVTHSHDTWLLSNRRELHRSPALEVAGNAALGHVGLGVDDFAHVDLYACFPVMVEMTSAAVDLDLTRPLTVTGGLGFAGAPVGNSVGQSLAAMTDCVRGGGRGLVHGNGGMATKHNFGVYSSEPPEAFAYVDCQDAVDLGARTTLAEDWSGPVTIEASTVLYDSDGPTRLVAAALDSEGARGWATTSDAGLMAHATVEGLAGHSAQRTAQGELRL